MALFAVGCPWFKFVIPGHAKREPGISRFRVWSSGPSRNDGANRLPRASGDDEKKESECPGLNLSPSPAPTPGSNRCRRRDHPSARRRRPDDGGVPIGEHPARSVCDRRAAAAGGVNFSHRHSGACVARTRNLEIPGSRFACPGMTIDLLFATPSPPWRGRCLPRSV